MATVMQVIRGWATLQACPHGKLKHIQPFKNLFNLNAEPYAPDHNHPRRHQSTSISGTGQGGCFKFVKKGNHKRHTL